MKKNKNFFLILTTLVFSFQLLFPFQSSFKQCEMSCCTLQQKKVNQTRTCCSSTSKKEQNKEQNFQEKKYSCNCSFHHDEFSSLLYAVNNKEDFSFVISLESKIYLVNQKIPSKQEINIDSFNVYNHYWSNTLKKTIVIRP